MYHKIIIIIFLVCGYAFGQSTNLQQIVASDGVNLYTNNASIMDSLEIIKPAYFCYSIGTDPAIVAESVSVVAGTIESGTVTNTRTIDQTYLLVGESAPPDIQFAFTNLTGNPTEILWEGYYEGNPAHVWNLYFWNYPDGQWDLILGDAIQDSSGDDFSVVAVVPGPQTNYINSTGCATSRFFHISSAVSSHDFATDYTAILQSQIEIPTAGVFVIASQFAECTTAKRFLTNPTAGTATNTTAGIYKASLGGTGTGTTNTTFTGSIFTNGVESYISFSRKIDSIGDVGNATASGFINLSAGTTVDFRLKSDKDNVNATFIDFYGSFEKIDN